MARDRLLAALLLAVGLLAVANGSWLFPHDGDRQYTYERAAITVENGTLDYRGADLARYHTENDLEAVGCQPRFDGVGRACAFDLRLLDRGPATVAAETGYSGGPTFVELRGAYYHRTVNRSGANATYDVDRVAPRTVLEAVATNVTGLGPGAVDRADSTPFRVAVTGETATTYERVEADRLGTVYRRGDGFYTVVVTAESSVDRPLVSPGLRDVLAVLGLALVLGAVVLAVPRVQEPLR